MTIISLNVIVENVFRRVPTVMAGTTAQITVMKMTVVSMLISMWWVYGTVVLERPNFELHTCTVPEDSRCHKQVDDGMQH